MSHEVVKRVGARAYRYRVERYRDPATGKPRARWTYLGREDVPDGETPEPRRPGRTRDRLLDAFGRLLEREEYEAIPVGRIADEAGLAHGTFYRHFQDKPSALRAAFAALKDVIDQQRPSFEGLLGTRDEERARLRAWVVSHFRATERPGLLRAWYTLAAEDPGLREERRARRDERVAGLAGYLERLVEAALIEPLATTPTAIALLAIFEGLFRQSVLEGVAFSDAAAEGAVAAFDRAVFGAAREPGVVPAGGGDGGASPPGEEARA